MREGTGVIDDERETPRGLAASEVMEEVKEWQRVRDALDAPQQSLPKTKFESQCPSALMPLLYKLKCLYYINSLHSIQRDFEN